MTSRAGYWIGGGLIVAGVVGAILWGVLSFVGDRRHGRRLRARARPRARRASSCEARKYIVYLEGPGADRDFAPPVEFLVVDPAGDRALPVAEYSASLTYSMSGHSGRAAGTVTPTRAGVYELRAATTASPSAGFAVALGDSIGGRIVRTILGAFAIGGVLLAAGIALLVTTGVRRGKRRTAADRRRRSDHTGLAGLPG